MITHCRFQFMQENFCKNKTLSKYIQAGFKYIPACDKACHATLYSVFNRTRVNEKILAHV